MTFVLGLTGGIASGKSTVSRLFQENNNLVIDADNVSREVVKPGTIGLEKIVNSFGKSILLEDGSLDRKKLGAIIFGNSVKREQLNTILQGEIRQNIECQIEEAKTKKIPLVVVDVPLLYEANYDRLMDKIMVVYVPESIQLTRLMKRNDLTKDEALSRIQSQMPIEEKKAKADWVIDNSGTIENTINQWSEWMDKNSKLMEI